MSWVIIIAVLLLAFYEADLLDKQDERKRQHQYRAGGKK